MTVEIDCSIGEGGGSVVRLLIALAAAKEQNVRLYNIRSRRKNPGLQMQHIESIKAIQQLSGGKVTGLYRGSQKLEFVAGKDKKNKAVVNIKTAGSIALLSQAVMYYSISRKEKITLFANGGATHGKWAPSIEYMEFVTHRFLNDMKKTILVDVNQYGFYPKGGAKCKISYEKHKTLVPLSILEKGELIEVSVISTASKSLEKREVAERQINSFLQYADLPVDPVVKVNYVNSLNPGTGLTVITKYENCSQGSFVVGEKGVSSETIGKACAKYWSFQYSDSAPVDPFAADQLIVPMAFAEGNSKIKTYELTNHTKTNIKLVKKILDIPIEVKKEENVYVISVSPK